MKKMLMFGIIFVCIIFCINYVIYNFRKQAYYRGDNIYIGDVKYESTPGIYDESDTVICYTDDGDTVYEVVGDPKHNYVSARSSWNAQLYVKEGYRVDKTAVEGYFFGSNYNNLLTGKEIINIMKELSESNEKADIDKDLLISLRKSENDVNIKYYNDPVGKYCGGIIFDGKDYVYYNWDKKEAVLISKEILNKLRELGVFS